jgi:uncharacterized membrane protein YfcA
MNPITGLLSALGVLTAVYIGGWVRGVQSAGTDGKTPATEGGFPTPLQLGVGAVTNFLDTLGIGSFATTCAMFRFWKMVPDRVIPGTLNVGHTLPTVAQAFIYTAVIPVDVVTLFSMITAAVLGAWLGAGVVCRWSKRNVQLGMGFALLAAAIFFTMRNLGLFPAGSDAIGVSGVLLVVAIAGNFLLGALMSLVMMGSCAFLMPIGSLRFIKERAYSLRSALGLAIGGLPGVLVAAYIVKSLDLTTVRWLVIVVVLYTAITMLVSAFNEKTEPPPAR